MKIIHKLINLLIITSLLTCGISFYMKKQLPPQESLLPEINKLPIQTGTSAEPFSFKFKNTNYEVTPKADYELWGLVVTHNYINNISDIYHDEESLDLKDICVIWGQNAKTGVYEKGKYKSGSWTCYWRFKSGEAWSQFSESQIANNHLITSDPTIQNQIRNVRIGDQVHIKGYLADYKNENTGWKRETSMTRKDTGNHACEVVYLEEFEVLKPGNELWYLMFYWSKWSILGLIILKIVLVFYSAHREVSKMDKNLTSKNES